MCIRDGCMCVCACACALACACACAACLCDARRACCVTGRVTARSCGPAATPGVKNGLACLLEKYPADAAEASKVQERIWNIVLRNLLKVFGCDDKDKAAGSWSASGASPEWGPGSVWNSGAASC